jgi:hypothetical protein
VVVGDILQQKGRMSEVTRGSNRRGREDLVHGGGPHWGSGSSVMRARSPVIGMAPYLSDLLKMHKEGGWRLWVEGIEAGGEATGQVARGSWQQPEPTRVWSLLPSGPHWLFYFSMIFK